jgi:predicted ester cyclase
MAGERNKAVMHRIADEIFSRGSAAAIDELVSQNYVERSDLPPGWPTGPASFKQWVNTVRTGFPDLTMTIDTLVVDGDRAYGFVTLRGTHKGTFFGVPPTGKTAQWTESHLCILSGGKLTEHWGVIDQYGLLQQLGVIPASPQS